MHYASLTETCRRIKSGEWRSEQVTQTLLARIDQLEPRLHSFARVRADQALATARQRDQQQAAGQVLGLLHGVPIAIKDLLFIAGEVAASGTMVMADYRPAVTATVVAKLEQAGAVIIGQTQLTEGAYGLHHPELTAPRNPWHPDFWTGVSSSGSGVAVAAGLAYAALGTDTGGSIRFPSACCGLAGIKPTYGRVSRYGAWPLGPSLDHIGPMARCVTDAARVLQVIAGPTADDPTALTDPVPNLAALTVGDLAGVRVGVDATYAGLGVDASIVALMQQASGLLHQQGAEVVEVTIPAAARTLADCWRESCGFETAAVHADYYPVQRHRYGPALESLIETGRGTSRERYQSLEAVRARFRSELTTLLESVDVLLLPNLPVPVPHLDIAEGRRAPATASADWLTFTAPFNYSGHPTLSLPAGLQTDAEQPEVQLPRGLQLIGPLLGEAILVRVGLALEAALDEQFGRLYQGDRLPPV